MKLIKVNAGQSVRFFTPPAAPPDVEKRTYLLDAILAIRQRYKFLQAPVTVDEHDFGKGVKFFRGWFGKTLINKLDIYSNGIICEATERTEAIDEFVDDFISWMQTEYGLTHQMGPRAYLSNIEVESEIGVGNKLEFLSGIGGAITLMLEAYGQTPRPFQPTLVGFSSDITNMTGPIPVSFQFDRRANEPFSKNIYFCSAPLATGDQLQVLERLEAIFAS
jgi:hypothetical protein